ncbi:hypothetical protein BGY98DRAFT_1086287, partial [Russula aff. rugulosa BPL654]
MRLSYSRLSQQPRALSGYLLYPYSKSFLLRLFFFPRSQLLASHFFRQAARGDGLCSLSIRGLPPTPRSIHITEWPRCASAEPGVSEPNHELALNVWRTGVRAGPTCTCVGGRFVMMPWAAGLQCFALPLVNKPGTSLRWMPCVEARDAPRDEELPC